MSNEERIQQATESFREHIAYLKDAFGVNFELGIQRLNTNGGLRQENAVYLFVPDDQWIPPLVTDNPQ